MEEDIVEKVFEALKNQSPGDQRGFIHDLETKIIQYHEEGLKDAAERLDIKIEELRIFKNEKV